MREASKAIGCRERRPTNREARYLSRDEVSGRKRGSQGEELFGVLGTLGAGSEGGNRSQDPSRGTGRSRTGKLSASRVTVASRVITSVQLNRVCRRM